MHWIGLVTGLGAVAVAWMSSPLRGLARLLGPEMQAVVALVAIFSVRPLFDSRFQDGNFYGYIPSLSGQDRAVMIGAACLGSLSAGMLLANFRTRYRRRTMSIEPDAESRRQAPAVSAARCALIAALFSGGYVAILTFLAGGDTVRRLSGGRSETLNIAGVPEIVFSLPLAGSISVAAYLLIGRDDVVPRRAALPLALAVLVSVTMVSQLGNRRYVIPALLIPAIAAIIRRPRRVGAVHVVGFGLTLMALAVTPYVRSAGARRNDEGIFRASLRYVTENGPMEVLKPIFTRHDTEMFDYVAVIASRAETFHFGLGEGTFIELLTRPLPHALWAGQAFSDRVLTSLWGGSCGEPYCPVASLAGVLYFDGGLAAVVIGSVIVGFLLRALSYRWIAHEAEPASLLRTVVISSFVLIAVRTNTVHAVWWCVYALIVAWPVLHLTRIPVVHRPTGSLGGTLSGAPAGRSSVAP